MTTHATKLNPQTGFNLTSTSDHPELPLIVYGELSILGYNGYIPNVERNGRRNRSKFLLCKRPAPNGIKKSRHYIVKQPQATKAIQDKDLHSISYTFSRSQTIIVEYRQDENTDMFQIGRSSEEPIDFVVMDTITSASMDGLGSSNNNNQQSNSGPSTRHHNENSSSSGQQNHELGLSRINRQLAKVGEELLQYGATPIAQDPRNRLNLNHRHQAQAVLLNYPQPNISNLPPLVADHFLHQNSSLYHHLQQHFAHSSGLSNQPLIQPQTNRPNGDHINTNSEQEHCPSGHNIVCSKRSHATQSTISRFACRILVDRRPPYTARIYAAGFDSSKNIFLGEKATKWEQNNSIDGLTTNGVLLMHPKKGNFYDGPEEINKESKSNHKSNDHETTHESGDNLDTSSSIPKQIRSSLSQNGESPGSVDQGKLENHDHSKQDYQTRGKTEDNLHKSINNNEAEETFNSNESNNNSDIVEEKMRLQKECGVWREVSVDGGIYAIRESRSAAQKGVRIEDESNILQDGTLIDLCGATLLWRSVEGFKASPTKKSLEEKIDMLNASRPQCPVGLNTLVIPRKPIIPSNHYHKTSHRSSHHSKDNDKNSHQPYVYLKCGHVQGYHDWGTTEKSNQRTCPICLSVGTVSKLSMGLEPSFYVDSGPLTHVFNPCGHMASERTVKYWCSIKIPYGTHFFHSICPFCASPLSTNEPASTKLIFQDDYD